jgi:glycine/D-amino acid oxidase-like deaminating enzyme
MPGPAVLSLPTDTGLPQAVDVVVIGAGIVGASTALELAERGHSVLLCDKGQVGAEQSSRNWGWVRIARRDPREVPLMAAALRLWDGLDARVGGDTGFRRRGILFTADTDRTMQRYATSARALEGWQEPYQLLDAQGIGRVLPGHRMRLAGALWTPRDGRAEPQRATPLIAAAARRAGATVLENCAVRGLDRSGGRVTGVVTEQGTVRCGAVVLAGGAWSRRFCHNEGVFLPQLTVRNTVLRTTPLDGGPDCSVWGRHFALRKRSDGGYTVASGAESEVEIVPDSFRLARQFWPELRVDYRKLSFRLSGSFLREMRLPRRWPMDRASPFEATRVLDPAPSPRIEASAWAAVRRAIPALASGRVVQRWAGMIDVTPDAIPVISAVPAVPGFFIATGFSGHGFGIGPAAGRLMADLVEGAAPLVDPADFRLSRFTDGSKIVTQGGF